MAVLVMCLAGCQTKMQVRQAQRELKLLTETATPIFEHNQIALLYCANGADHDKIRQAITQTRRDVDMWFADVPRHYTSRLLIFTPDEPLGLQLLREMQTSKRVAGNTEARTHTILITGYPSEDDFWITLRHELTHDAMLRHFDSVEQLPPFWLTEGMATVFEVPAYADGKPAVNAQRLKRLKMICQSGQLELEPLLTRASNERSSSTDYAQAWGLTYYLLRQHSQAMRVYLATYQHRTHITINEHRNTFDACFSEEKGDNVLSEHLTRWAQLQTMR